MALPLLGGKPQDQEADVRAGVEALLAGGAEVLVISFLHSYANPENERRTLEIARDLWPNDFVVIGSEILPAIREFERTSTAVISGYVQPLIGRYIRTLTAKLSEQGYDRDLLIVQSNGGVVAGSIAPRFAANTILSGPAAGVTAVTAIANQLGIAEAASCDMGGTSLDICVIRNGAAAVRFEKPIDFGMPLCVPMVDIEERYGHVVEDAEVTMTNVRTVGLGPRIAEGVPRVPLRAAGAEVAM